MKKLAKSEVDYSLGMKNSHCGRVFKDDSGYCRHFLNTKTSAGKDGQCELVEGSISPVYWCDRFKKVGG